MSWSVGLVQPAEHARYGFSIMNEDGTPICSFEFKTMEEAETAAALMRKAIDRPLVVRAHSR